MRSGPALYLFAAAILLSAVAGCAGVNSHPTPIDGGGGSGANVGTDAGRQDIPAIEVGDPTKCGNGVLDSGEACDTGNRTGGNGCSALCQIWDGWSCAGTPSACTQAGACGDGRLQGTEECDDGNMAATDGCGATCQVESGYECRVPGRRCVPLCGDSMKIGMEQCDDGNTANGDGCSVTCQVEPGSVCTGTGPGSCTAPNCGDGKKEGNEGCDCGTSLTGPWPTGCTGPNGLFNGDASGCSKTCTKEPTCRGGTGGAGTHVCTSACGNGNIEMAETCDDGNTDSGDGCSSTCVLEAGFMCSIMSRPDTATCAQPGNTGDCLSLPVKYRDFKSEHETGGHPDFFYYGTTIPNPITVQSTTHGSVAFSKRFCVPNSSGPARQNDSTPRCWGMAQDALDNAGRPAFNMSRTGGTTCDCQFTDWNHNGNGNYVPGYGDGTAADKPLSNPPLMYVNSGNMLGSPWYRGPAPVVTSAASFGQWFTDSSFTNNTHVVGTLELGAVAGQAGLYRFSSPPHSVWGGFFPLDPPANNFPVYSTTGSSAGPGAARTSITGNMEPLLCNLWPYWYAGTTASPGFGAANGCRGPQYVFPPAFGPLITSDPAAWFGMHPNGDWVMGMTAIPGWYHDSWFSTEVRYLFAFTGPFSLQFFGDDDTFIFINGRLVIDLGGVHQRLPGKVTVDASGNATIQEGGNIYMACTNAQGQTNCPPVPPAGSMVGDIIRCTGGADPQTKQMFNATCSGGTCDCRERMLTAAQLGLAPTPAGQPANTYEIAVFSRDGHPSESNFQLTLSGFATRQSVCMPRCGDGKQTGAEECDCGDSAANMSTDPTCGGKINDGSYGGCTVDCKYGPYCGDAIPDTTAGEECDLGSKMNTANYSTTQVGGCTPGCKYPHFCGDGLLDANEGEGCDLGAANGTADAPCSADCKVIFG